MSSFNQVTLMGHLTADPELTFLESQTAVCAFSLAVNDSYKNAAGNKVEKTCFVDCSIFGKRGEAFNKHLKKGQPVLISGKLVFDTWTDDAGAKHYKHKIQAREFSFVGSKAKGGENES